MPKQDDRLDFGAPEVCHAPFGNWNCGFSWYRFYASRIISNLLASIRHPHTAKAKAILKRDKKATADFRSLRATCKRSEEALACTSINRLAFEDRCCKGVALRRQEVENDLRQMRAKVAYPNGQIGSSRLEKLEGEKRELVRYGRCTCASGSAAAIGGVMAAAGAAAGTLNPANYALIANCACICCLTNYTAASVVRCCYWDVENRMQKFHEKDIARKNPPSPYRTGNL